MKDLTQELGVATRTGELSIGYNNVIKLLQTGSPKLVIVSEMAPSDMKETLLYYSKLANVRYLNARNSALELGSSCGKPFPIAALAVLDAGDSDLLSTKNE